MIMVAENSENQSNMDNTLYARRIFNEFKNHDGVSFKGRTYFVYKGDAISLRINNLMILNTIESNIGEENYKFPVTKNGGEPRVFEFGESFGFKARHIFKPLNSKKSLTYFKKLIIQLRKALQNPEASKKHIKEYWNGKNEKIHQWVLLETK